MLTILDHLLDRITMYRLVLYYLIVLLVVAAGLSAAGALAFDPFALAFSAGFLVIVCLISNAVFASVFEAPTNLESAYITALILALIVNPIKIPHDILFLGWAGTLAMASKYILAIRKQHIFNPAAAAVVVTSIGIGQSASWWVANTWMLPAVIIGGLLVVRKIGRTDLVASFLVTAVIGEVLVSLSAHTNLLTNLRQTLFLSPLVFFGFVMLTEPQTTPPTNYKRMGYGALVGVLFLPQLHIGSLYSTPELALVASNVVAYIISPKVMLRLQLKQRVALNASSKDFRFELDHPLKFSPGQYLEWTLPHPDTDARGSRRYFTIASSPTEPDLHIGVKFYPRGSSFKKALLALDTQVPITAAHLAGDFVLPRNTSRKIACIAGGIGITPYRSMIKYLLDTGEKRDLTLLYAVNRADELAYREVFDHAAQVPGIRVTYVIADANSLPPNWRGEVGVVDAEVIKRQVPDYLDRLFYVSGPPQMVEGVTRALHYLGVRRRHIKTDFFPGYV